MRKIFGRTEIILLLAWSCLFAVITAFRPLMPVDETRYLSVAWEMWLKHSYILPTLNFAPYSHKPPMLFWLINAMWELFGVHLWAARIVPFTVTAAFVLITGKLARRLIPNGDTIGAYAMLALSAMPMFLIYGSVIMFDTLMGVWVNLAILVVWRQGQQEAPQWKWWFALGGIIGLGILAKGPVALIYMLPAALLAPLWRPVSTTGKWYAGIGVAVLTGAAIALAWAIPAVLTGGPEYGDKIFITQSAGRMVHAFDHRRPFYFYVFVLIAYLLPFLAWPSIWSAAKNLFGRSRLTGPAFSGEPAVRFILCWIVPAFLFFSAISSKQFHYMTPLLPGFAVLAALLLSKNGLPKPNTVSVPMVLMVVPSIVILVYEAMGWKFMDVTLPESAEHFGYLHVALAAALAYWAHKKPRHTFQALSLAAFLMAIMIHVQMGQKFLPRYDLSPLAPVIAPYHDGPIASAPKYDGEYGYILGLRHAIDAIDRPQIDTWFSTHPDGVVIARFKKDHVPENYVVLYRQDFRNDEELVLLQRKVMVGMK